MISVTSEKWRLECESLTRELASERTKVQRLEADARRLDWMEKHLDGMDVRGSGAADDKWWIVIHHDGQLAEDATLRTAIDAAIDTTPTDSAERP